MNYAVYNRKNNTIKTYVTRAIGQLPDDYEFLIESDVPSDAVMETNELSIVDQKEEIYNEALNRGYQIPNTNIYLAIQDKDRIAYNQLLTLLNEMLSANLASLDTKISIIDKDGVSHSFTIQQVKTILTGLGYYYYTLWIARNT